MGPAGWGFFFCRGKGTEMRELNEVRCPCGNLLVLTSRDSGRGMMTCLACQRRVRFDIQQGEVHVRVMEAADWSWPSKEDVGVWMDSWESFD